MTASVRILAALLIGLLTGALLAGTTTGDRIATVATPMGRLWLDALTMTVVPLIFTLLVTGIIAASRVAAGAAIAARSIGAFAVGLLLATGLAALLTPLLLTWLPVPEAARGLQTLATAALPPTPGAWYENIIPTNPIAAAAEGAMVPLVLFASIFGLAVSRIEPDLRASVDAVARGIVQAMLVIVNWVLLIAPLGVAALAYGVGLRLGASAAGVLVHYMAIVIAMCLAVGLLAALLAVLLTGLSPLRFVRAALPAQLIAVSTQSSLASLPAMVRSAPGLSVDAADAGVVLPLAVAVFKAASAGANVAVAVYLAQLHGIALDVPTLALGALVAAAVSVGAIGLPAQVNFFAVIAPVCLAMGVPVALLPILLAVKSIPDIFRTLGNVTADLAVCRITCRKDVSVQSQTSTA